MRRAKRAEQCVWSIFATCVGFGGVVAGEGGLVEVFLPFQVASRREMEERLRAAYPGATEDGPLSREAARLLEGYFAGKVVTFELPLDEGSFTPFQRQVYGIVRRIPRGGVMTYGQVAALLGRRGAARGVGVAMARNPLPIIIPCHRVVGSGGALIGYSGAGGTDSKRWLLQWEGAGL
ncbi:MAG: methylated-DNA--[protein]-cysteine S-methyltransferase [Desulfuromonadales bacterium]|nr:MAG: methylated-DNA--[protein]-cysteine S-methyltransferase [Desulfuromonadales bacterium]